ncbi:MAG: hypothetical protein KKD36_08300 [Bacteroidetes bacterium]|nr:hypothetical protein [Bacteroidota bacterium]
MEKINILYIGRHLEILSTVVRVINANENWNAVGAMNDEESKAVFREIKFDIVLLGSGISDESEISLRCFFEIHNPEAIVMQHYGGGSGLLKSEILSCLEEFNRKERTHK